MYCFVTSAFNRSGRRGAALQDEAALRTVGHDHRVLHLLRLHQAQDLGPVVLLAIGPADAAARDRAASEMDRLQLGRVHEDLEQRERLHHVRHVARAKLERERHAIGLVRVRSDRGLDGPEQVAQDLILVERRYLSKVVHDVTPDHLELVVGGVALEVEPGLEVGDELGGDRRVLGQRVVAILLGEPRRDALAILAVGPQDPHLLPGQPTGDHEPVQRIRFGVTPPDGADALLDPGRALLQVEHGAPGVQDAEVVDVDLALTQESGRDLLDDAQAERLQDGHERREIHLAAGLVELHAGESLAGGLVAQADHEPVDAVLQLFQAQHVVDDQRPIPVRLEVLGEAGRVRVGERGASLGADPLDQGVAEIVVPGAGQAFDLLLELLVRHLGDLHAGIDVHREEDPRALGLAERQVVVDRRSVEALDEEPLQALAQIGVEAVAGQGHHDGDAPAVEVAADQHADAAVALELQQTADEPSELARRGLEQLVLRERLEERRRGLVVV